MRWLRAHRRPWSWTALLALVLQLGLSFGHVHGPHAERPAITLTAPVEAGDTANPGTDTRDPRDTDYCAICAILALLTGAQTANAPTVALPVALAPTEIALPGEALRIGSPRVAFHSRAPPQA